MTTDFRTAGRFVIMLRLVVRALDRVYCLSGIIGETILDESHIDATERVRRPRHYREPKGRTTWRKYG